MPVRCLLQYVKYLLCRVGKQSNLYYCAPWSGLVDLGNVTVHSL